MTRPDLEWQSVAFSDWYCRQNRTDWQAAFRWWAEGKGFTEDEMKALHILTRDELVALGVLTFTDAAA